MRIEASTIFRKWMKFEHGGYFLAQGFLQYNLIEVPCKGSFFIRPKKRITFKGHIQGHIFETLYPCLDLLISMDETLFPTTLFLFKVFNYFVYGLLGIKLFFR